MRERQTEMQQQNVVYNQSLRARDLGQICLYFVHCLPFLYT